MNSIPCPACSKPSVLVRALDFCVHKDGTANDACWKAISRGDVTVPDDLIPNCCPGRTCRPWNLREFRRHLDKLDREAAAR